MQLAHSKFYSNQFLLACLMFNFVLSIATHLKFWAFIPGWHIILECPWLHSILQIFTILGGFIHQRHHKAWGYFVIPAIHQLNGKLSDNVCSDTFENRLLYDFCPWGRIWGALFGRIWYHWRYIVLLSDFWTYSKEKKLK